MEVNARPEERFSVEGRHLESGSRSKNGGRDAATEVDSRPRPAQPHHLRPQSSSAHFETHIYHGRSANRRYAGNNRAEGCGVSSEWVKRASVLIGRFEGYWGVVLARNIHFQLREQSRLHFSRQKLRMRRTTRLSQRARTGY